MISAYFSSFGKLPASILSLKIWHRYWENKSLFSFNILTGISSCSAAFLVFKLLISFAICLSTGTKENSVGFLKYCFTPIMLGCLLYFLLHAITDQFHLPYHNRCSHLFDFSCVHNVAKKRVESFSYFCIICRNFSTFNKCYFVVLRPIFFSEKWRFFLE